MMNCDTCKWYAWYYDKCNKYDCEVDGRSVCNGYEKFDTIILDAMVDYGKAKRGVNIPSP